MVDATCGSFQVLYTIYSLSAQVARIRRQHLQNLLSEKRRLEAQAVTAKPPEEKPVEADTTGEPTAAAVPPEGGNAPKKPSTPVGESTEDQLFGGPSSPKPKLNDQATLEYGHEDLFTTPKHAITKRGMRSPSQVASEIPPTEPASPDLAAKGKGDLGDHPRPCAAPLRSGLCATVAVSSTQLLDDSQDRQQWFYPSELKRKGTTPVGPMEAWIHIYIYIY